MLQDFTKTPFDIFILAGQSNANGTGFGVVDKPYQPNDRVWYMNGDDTISLAVEQVYENFIQSNFSLSFAQEYMAAGKLAEGRKILILRAAVGGTGFLDGYWKPNDPLFLHMMEMIRTALAMNPENRLVALLWHQGESDALLHATYQQHYGHLSTLVELTRTTFAVPTLPFIAGDFVQQWKTEYPEECAPVIDAIRAVCRDCTSAGFVETDGLKSNNQENIGHPVYATEDTIHFSRPALYELGKRYFAEFTEIA